MATELPASSILRLFVTAVGSSDFCGELIADGLVVLATFAFCGLLLARTGFFPASEVSSELELPSESESEPDVELESSADVEDPEDSESLSLSSEPLMEGRVWLDPAGERGLDTSGVVVPPTPITMAFGVGVSSESEESESESVGVTVSKGLEIKENTYPRIPTSAKQRQFFS